jgi:ABC-type multidrug transport system fused ATPase/permease subunit
MKQSIVTLLPYLKRHRTQLALGMGALVMKDLLAVLSPLIMKKGVDALTTHFELRDVFLFAC